MTKRVLVLNADYSAISLCTVPKAFLLVYLEKAELLKGDKDAVLRSGIIPKGMDSLVVDQMVIGLKGNGLEKKDLMILDLIVSNNWERPIYFNNTSMSQVNLDLSPFVVQEGNAFRLLPIRNPTASRGEYLVDTDKMFENVCVT